MKKVLWLVVCLMTMVISANAQDKTYPTAEKNGWKVVNIEADELTETEEGLAFIYSDNNGNSIVLWDNESKKIRIVANDAFNSSVTKWYFDYISIFAAKIGYYDINDKLIKKSGCQFKIGANHREGNSMHNNWGVNEGKTIILYLRNKKGYVRIVAPLAGTNAKFDLKIPCMNN